MYWNRLNGKERKNRSKNKAHPHRHTCRTFRKNTRTGTRRGWTFFVFAGKNKTPTSGCIHMPTHMHPTTYVHIHTWDPALRHKLVKHTLSTKKLKKWETSAEHTQDILAIILWPGRGLVFIRILDQELWLHRGK